LNDALRYRNEVWLLMHRDDPSDERETASLRLYMDESGGKDPNTPHAIIGGMHMFRGAFLPFEEKWDQMLKEHGLLPDGLHMKEFGRHGKYGGMSYCCRRELFLRVVELIQSHKAFSFDVGITNADYTELLPEAAREQFGVYAMCFHMAVMVSHKMAENSGSKEKIPFIMDAGNPYKGQIVKAHAFMLKMFQKHVFINAGGLFFDDDKEFGVLQAADVIAWGARRRASNLPLHKGFEPIATILDDPKFHHPDAWKREWLADLGKKLQGIINSGKGAREVTDEDFGV
jgi:hypothetical protein